MFFIADSSPSDFSVSAMGISTLTVYSRLDYEIVNGWSEGPQPSKAAILSFGRSLLPPICVRLCRILMFPLTGETEMIIVLGSLIKGFRRYSSDFGPSVAELNICTFFLESSLCYRLWNTFFKLF